MTRVAVVILNYNGRSFLEKFLPSVLQHSESAQIVVADNASTDDSVDFMQHHYPSVRLVEMKENHGFAGGYNVALKQVEADYFVLLNSDVEVTPQWLSPLVTYLDNHPECAAVQPKILDWHQRDRFEYAGAAGGFIDGLGYPYCRGRVFDTLETDQGQYDTPVNVDWTSGACMIVRSEAFFEAGGFDADFFAHMEEIDLCWRLRSMGHALVCVPESIVFHVGGGTLHKSSPHKTYLNFRNGLALLLKNLPTSQLIWKIPLRLILDGVAALKFAFESSPTHLLAVLKAHVHFYMHVPKHWRKREKTSPVRRPVILFKYFLSENRTYSALNQ